MLYADEIRRQAEAAPRAALPAVTAALWRAFAEGHVPEAEAEALSVLIESRQASETRRSPRQTPNPTGTGVDSATDAPDRQGSPRTGVGSRPRTDASLERRRRWAASGRLPPALAARFTPAEQAALALIAAEAARRSDCRMAIEHIAAVAGVSRSTVKAAIREARKLGLLTVEERRITGFRNDTNVVRIVSPEWTAWLRLARKEEPSRYPPNAKGVADRDRLGGGGLTKRYPIGAEGGGVKSLTGTSTQNLKPGKTGTARSPRGRIAAHGRVS